jgi:hypothetical protein
LIVLILLSATKFPRFVISLDIFSNFSTSHFVGHRIVSLDRLIFQTAFLQPHISDLISKIATTPLRENAVHAPGDDGLHVSYTRLLEGDRPLWT